MRLETLIQKDTEQLELTDDQFTVTPLFRRS